MTGIVLIHSQQEDSLYKHILSCNNKEISDDGIHIISKVFLFRIILLCTIKSLNFFVTTSICIKKIAYNVNHKLNKEYQGEFDLAPFIVITDPKRANKLTRRNGILA